jgi:hypothetical protein
LSECHWHPWGTLCALNNILGEAGCSPQITTAAEAFTDLNQKMGYVWSHMWR